MSHSVQLTTPIPSAEKVAERLGLSPQRRKMLFDLVDGRNGKVVRSAARKDIGHVAAAKKASRKRAPTSR